MTTPRFPTMLTHCEGERTAVPEGGELVCIRKNEGLALKIEYSREMMIRLSSSIFCHQRPVGFAQLVQDTPELLGLPSPIPTAPPPPESAKSPPPHNHHASPLHLYSPLRGPVTIASEQMRMLSIQREFNKRMSELDNSFESPSIRY